MENEALENGQREATLKDLEVIQLLHSIFATLRLIYFSFLIVLFFSYSYTECDRRYQ